MIATLATHNPSPDVDAPGSGHGNGRCLVRGTGRHLPPGITRGMRIPAAIRSPRVSANRRDQPSRMISPASGPHSPPRATSTSPAESISTAVGQSTNVRLVTVLLPGANLATLNPKSSVT